MIVVITVVGIRNYLLGGEDDYPKLFARLPIGSSVYLKKEPTGAEFPGSVSVWDSNSRMIGYIAKTERRYIELDIPQGEMLKVTVSNHSAVDNCIYVKADNKNGFNEPYIRKIQLIEGETEFKLTEYDLRIQQLTAMMKTKIREVEDGTGSVESLMQTGEDYAQYCCKSLDGETTFSRGDIIMKLRVLKEQYPEIDSILSQIYENHKDLGRKYNDVIKIVYKEQYNRILESAKRPNANGKSQLDNYLEKLKFINDDVLTEKVIKDEIHSLSNLLGNEMMKTYSEIKDSDEDFAKALYSLNYCWTGLYRLYSRRIKREFLQELLDKKNSQQTENSSVQQTDATNIPSVCKDAISKVVIPSFKIKNSVVLNSASQLMKASKHIDLTKPAHLALLMRIGQHVDAIKPNIKNPVFVRALIGLGIIPYVDNNDITKKANGINKKIKGNGTSVLPTNYLQWKHEDREIGKKIYEAIISES